MSKAEWLDRVYASAVNSTIETEREDDGRWIAEDMQRPGILAYGTTEMEAVNSVHTIALAIDADELDTLRGENRRLHAALDEIVKQNEGMQSIARLAEFGIATLQEINSALVDNRHSAAVVIRDLLEQIPSKEFAVDEKQQAVWKAKAWLEASK